MNSLPRAALAYAARGIPVFPVNGVVDGRCTCGHDPAWHLEKKRKPGKHPVGKHGLLEATTDLDQVAAWWRRNPVFNIGLTPGPASGFWVLDIDGPGAEAALDALQDYHRPLPATPAQATGKGRHLLFAWPTDWPDYTCGEIRNSASKIGPGIDVRGAGGYIVAAPSMHENGRAYAWAPGRGLLDLAFAETPDWLLRLVSPEPAKPVPVAPARPRAANFYSGRATPYGEAAISNQCRRVQTAPRGKQNDTLWLAAISLGQLVGGGEIQDEGYALAALRSAGQDMVAAGGSRWTDREEDTLARGFRVGVNDPRSAPERGPRAPAARAEPSPRPVSTPADQAATVMDARGVWDSARPAGVWAVFNWLKARGISAGAIPGALDRLRVHARAPLPGGPGPALVAPLQTAAAGPVNGVALLALDGQSDRFCRLLGETKRRAVILSEGLDDTALVAIDLQDGWRLGAQAWAELHPIAVAITPNLKSFAGGMRGDRFGRVNLATPDGDPDDPPWTLPEINTVIVALRRDLRSPELRVRKAGGGTLRVTLQGEEAARFYGGLVEQAWRRPPTDDGGGGPGANAVRLLWPSHGAVSFSPLREGVECRAM